MIVQYATITDLGLKNFGDCSLWLLDCSFPEKLHHLMVSPLNSEDVLVGSTVNSDQRTMDTSVMLSAKDTAKLLHRDHVVGVGGNVSPWGSRLERARIWSAYFAQTWSGLHCSRRNLVDAAGSPCCCDSCCSRHHFDLVCCGIVVNGR